MTAPEAWKLKDFAKAAAPCKSLSLSVSNDSEWSLDIRCLSSVGHSLVSLSIDHGMECPVTSGIEVFSCLTVLTELKLSDQLIVLGEPWEDLASLATLKGLSLDISASGDPSPLSALTGLTRLHLGFVVVGENVLDGPSFRFTSLQPLSGMHHLEELSLTFCCEVTSLHGLSGLSRLRTLSVKESWELSSLVGVSTAVMSLQLDTVPGVGTMAGVEALGQLQQIDLSCCGLTSLQPLAGLSNLHTLVVREPSVYGDDVAAMVSLDGIEGLTSCLRRLNLRDCRVLSSLVGLEKLSGLQELSVDCCGVTSLQPVAELKAGGLTMLSVTSCRMVQEEVLELPHIQPTAHVEIRASIVKEVVLAGGVSKAVSPHGMLFG